MTEAEARKLALTAARETDPLRRQLALSVLEAELVKHIRAASSRTLRLVPPSPAPSVEE